MQNLELAYQEALDYIYSFIDYSLKRNLHNAEAIFKLDRMVRFMHLLGDPQNQYKIIHVAGTKGKGSVAAFCAHALQTAGYSVGLYTSPHLQDFTERIQVNGEEISKETLVRLVNFMKPFVQQVPEVTTFELTTALGFLYFLEMNIEVAVLEVGLGGRLDATNIVEPLVSVITSISYDHEAVLGNTLSKIAFEKGGIIKQGRPVVIAPQKEAVRKRLKQLCEERDAPLIEVGKDVMFAAGSHMLDAQTLFLWTREEQPLMDAYTQIDGKSVWSPLQLTISLLGYHQVINAATAYTALRIADDNGLKISTQAIVEGFAKTFWPGRFELLRRDPPVIIDSAHNTDSCQRLLEAIDDYFPGVPFILVFGVSADKDIDGMLEALIPRIKKVITSQSVHPRAMDARELLALVQKHNNLTPSEAIVPIEKALQTALLAAGNEVGIIVTGSLFLAAAGRAVWPSLRH